MNAHFLFHGLHLSEGAYLLPCPVQRQLVPILFHPADHDDRAALFALVAVHQAAAPNPQDQAPDGHKGQDHQQSGPPPFRRLYRFRLFRQYLRFRGLFRGFRPSRAVYQLIQRHLVQLAHLDQVIQSGHPRSGFPPGDGLPGYVHPLRRLGLGKPPGLPGPGQSFCQIHVFSPQQRSVCRI